MASKASNGGYSQKTWKAIKKEWLAGQLSVSDIARNYGPSRQAISKRAREKNWPARGSLVEEVRKEVQTLLLEDEKVAPTVAPSEACQIVESAARRGVEVIRNQRTLLSRLLGVAAATLQELEEMQLITRETLNKKRTKAQALLVASLSKAKLDGMKAVSQVLAQAIPLERQAFSLDKDDGGAKPIKYVAPDYVKPAHAGLSEDQWED
jgi:hypothetical protein